MSCCRLWQVYNKLYGLRYALSGTLAAGAYVSSGWKQDLDISELRLKKGTEGWKVGRAVGLLRRQLGQKAVKCGVRSRRSDLTLARRAYRQSAA